MSCNSDRICNIHIMSQSFNIKFGFDSQLAMMGKRLLFYHHKRCILLLYASVHSKSLSRKSAFGAVQINSLISWVLRIEVSPFTWALIRPFPFYLCKPCCFKNDDRVGVHLPMIQWDLLWTLYSVYELHGKFHWIHEGVV